MAISRDNQFVASGQIGGGLVRIWRIASPPDGREIPMGHNSRVRLSKDGRLLVPSGRPDFDCVMDRTRVYEVDTATPAGPEIVPGGIIMDADFSPDGTWLAIVCSDTPGRGPETFEGSQGSGTLQFWDWRTGQRMGEPIACSAEPRAVSVHPHGKSVGVYGARMTLKEVEVSTREVRDIHTAPAGNSTAEGTNARCRYSPDGRVLIAWGMDRPPVAWDRVTEKRIPIEPLALARVMDIDFHGDIMGTASFESRMEFLSLPGFQSAAPQIQDTNWLFVGKFNAEGDLFLTGGRGRIGRVWDWRRSKLNCPALHHDGEIFGGAFIPGTPCVVTGGLDQCIRFWDRRTGLPLRSPLPQGGNVMNLTATPDGRALISDTKYDGHIKIYDVATVLPKPALSPEDALLLAEIDASSEILNGALEPLSAAAWLKKWQQFRSRYPEWHRLKK